MMSSMMPYRLSFTGCCRAILAVAIGLLVVGCASVPVSVSQAPKPTGLPMAQSAPDSQPAIAGQPGLQQLANETVTSVPVVPIEFESDLWKRIRRNFALTNLHGNVVEDREQWYAQRPDYVQRMATRSQKYLYHIVEEIEQRGMPSELALLPFVESAFNPRALSVAKASGMWQFMPATGRDFDLKQNAFRDDRRDIMASTRAALDYLQRLYRMFGDWHLALAAYNWGEGNVGRAIARNEKAGLPTQYSDLNMPSETRLYVPNLQAIKNIIAQPERFGLALPDIPNHPYFQTVPLVRDMDVSVAARLAEISVEDFRSLNPSVDKPVLLAAGVPSILLPWDNAEVFQRNLEASGQSVLANWTVWVVPVTMKIADAAKHAGMSVSEFRSVNNIPAGQAIRAKSALLVPRPESKPNDVSEELANHGQVALMPEGRKARRGANKKHSADVGRTKTKVQAKTKSTVQSKAKPKAKAKLKAKPK